MSSFDDIHKPYFFRFGANILSEVDFGKKVSWNKGVEKGFLAMANKIENTTAGRRRSSYCLYQLINATTMKLPRLIPIKLLLLFNLTTSSALYDSSSPVESFETSKDFRNRIIENDGISLIQFYAPWCGHCKKFTPAYNQIASLLKGIATVGAIDASSDGPGKRIASEYGVGSFPTLKLFRGEGKEVADVKSRDPNEIVNAVLGAIQKTIQERAGGGNGNAGGNAGNTDSNTNSNTNGGKDASNVMQLTSTNFAQKVYDNPEIIAIAFIAPWCGHCKNLIPEWTKASSQLINSGATLAIIDATEEEALAAEFGVQGFPTIKIFPGGKKNKSDVMDYEGGREAEQIVQYVLQEVDRSGVPKEISELTSQAILDETCQGRNKICVLAALPHILETGAEGRNKYKAIIMDASKAVRGMAFQFAWFEGSSQPQLEKALDLTFGFPAIAAYSMEKGVYTVHRSSFTEMNVRKFLMGITTGKQATYKIEEVPLVETVERWDGKDGVPFEEEYWDDDDDDGDGDGDTDDGDTDDGKDEF